LGDSSRQGVRGHEGLPPQCVQKFLLGDDAFPIGDEKTQKIEHLWLDGDDGAAPLHRHAAEVDVNVAEFTGSRFRHGSVSGAGRIIIGRHLIITGPSRRQR
jgi:hypothetical protein